MRRLDLADELHHIQKPLRIPQILDEAARLLSMTGILRSCERLPRDGLKARRTWRSALHGSRASDEIRALPFDARMLLRSNGFIVAYQRPGETPASRKVG